MKIYEVGVDVFETLYIRVAAENEDQAEEFAINEFLKRNQGEFHLQADTFEVQYISEDE